MCEDNKLLSKIQAGDLDAFNTLVEKYQKKVFNIAYNYMGNTEDASEIAQEAFLRAYTSLKGFRNESSFKTWLYNITANVCKDELRKRKKFNMVSFDSPVMYNDQELKKEYKADSFTPEECYEIKENQETVRKIISMLPEDYKIILILRELKELSYDEISETLDCSLGTVKSRLSRARKMFKDEMLKYWEQKKQFTRQIR